MSNQYFNISKNKESQDLTCMNGMSARRVASSSMCSYISSVKPSVMSTLSPGISVRGSEGGRGLGEGRPGEGGRGRGRGGGVEVPGDWVVGMGVLGVLGDHILLDSR